MNMINIVFYYLVNFPSNYSGKLGDVYYTVFNGDGTTAIARTNSGVVEYSKGRYGVPLSFATAGDYVIIWDIDGESNIDAGENFKIVDYDISKIDDIYDANFGKWKIENNQMAFYKDDNVTEIARFDLFDLAGAPSQINVFERVKV